MEVPFKDGAMSLVGNAVIVTGVESVGAVVSRMCTAVTVRTRLKGKTRKERRLLRLESRTRSISSELIKPKVQHVTSHLKLTTY